MLKETEKRLACSLTAETTELLPFLPYLLQDLWELGSDPREMIRLIRKHVPISKDTKILDLACGKGAVSIKIAESLGINVYGFDLIPEFIEYANQMAKKLNVETLCHFFPADVNDAVEKETNYDCVIFGSAGNVLGGPKETLHKLLKTIKPKGFILIDEAYLSGGLNNGPVKYKKYEYLPHGQWMNLFSDCGLKMAEEVINNGEEKNFDSDKKAIAARAEELILLYPGKRKIFNQYVQSQLNEYADLEEHTVVGVVWILQRL